MTEEAARAVSQLLGAATYNDVADATAVESTARRADSIITSDPGHIERVVTASRQNLIIEVL